MLIQNLQSCPYRAPATGWWGEPSPQLEAWTPPFQRPAPRPDPGPALPYLGPAESAPPCCTCPWLPTMSLAVLERQRGEEGKAGRRGRVGGNGRARESPGLPTQLWEPGSSSRPPLRQRAGQSEAQWTDG